RPLASELRPALVVMSIGVIVTTSLLLSTWYTRVAEPDVVSTSSVAGIVPPTTLMLNALLAKAVVTVPNGRGVGSRIVHGTDQPVMLAGSPQIALDPPHADTGPTVPPKFTPPFVAATKSAMAFAPVVTFA